MQANSVESETDLIGGAVAWLRERVPEGWEVERVGPDGNTPPEGNLGDDAVLYIRSPNRAIGTLAVQARPSLEPREAAQLLPSLAQTLRSLAGSTPVLVVAPWLSERTRRLLVEQELNYIDLTGNARLSLSSPGLFISADGANRNPAPRPRGRALVRGPRAARLIRLLADVRPPYGVSELARAADLTPGYVSRLLDTLDSEALLARSRRGVVDQVDFVPLLRRWTESYDVLHTNRAFAFLAPNGAADIVQRLAGDARDERYLITGSFAAVRMAPVAAPALLLVYSDDPASLARKLGLLPADEGANVVLLAPFDPVIWKRSNRENGLRYVCPSQVAADCLSGTGRMPVEAEALLEWLPANERAWRWGSLSQSPGERAVSEPASPAAVDPLYVAARSVLIDALTALQPHGLSVIVAGAQAIYLHTGGANLAIAPYTTDGDLALNPAKLANAPTLEAAMRSANFQLSTEPGIWLATARVAEEDVRIPVDLIVPEGVATGAGRRDARLQGQGQRVARRARGLEGALVDHSPLTIRALNSDDQRSIQAEVAGPAALLVAKLHKLHERVESRRAARIDDKDAADILRIMQTTDPTDIMDTFATLIRDPIAGEPTTTALTYLEALFGTRGCPGIAMAQRALRTAMPPERIQALCVGYTAAIRERRLVER